MQMKQHEIAAALQNHLAGDSALTNLVFTALGVNSLAGQAIQHPYSLNMEALLESLPVQVLRKVEPTDAARAVLHAHQCTERTLSPDSKTAIKRYLAERVRLLNQAAARENKPNKYLKRCRARTDRLTKHLYL